MRARRGGPTLGAGALGLAAAAASAAAPPTFELVRLRSDVTAEQRIGRHRSGLICGPAGVLRWREVSPDAAAAAKRAAAALRDAGLDIFVPDPDVLEGENGATSVRIEATIVAATMDACTAWHGIRLSHDEPAIKTHGRLIVIWRAYDRRTRAMRLKVTSCRDFHDDTARSGERAVQDAVAAMATEAEPLLATAAQPTDKGPLPAQQLGCAPAELAMLARPAD